MTNAPPPPPPKSPPEAEPSDRDDSSRREPPAVSKALAPAEPLERATLLRVFRLAHSAIELVLTEPARLTQTIASQQHTLLLAALLAYVTVLLSLPYGAVLDIDRFWRISLLLIGTLAICLPSLQVFSAYIGFRVDLKQNLALGLVITSVAALFCFGFFPILWFLKATMLEDSQVTPTGISVVLLLFALLAGVGHLFRCFRSFDKLVGGYRALMTMWLVLFHFIAFRMGQLLDLL